jgi:hypothetical protein
MASNKKPSLAQTVQYHRIGLRSSSSVESFGIRKLADEVQVEVYEWNKGCIATGQLYERDAIDMACALLGSVKLGAQEIARVRSSIPALFAEGAKGSTQ